MNQTKFERRHMNAIAGVIRNCHPGDSNSGYVQWDLVKGKMGDMLAYDNPRFDRGRFEEACEP